MTPRAFSGSVRTSDDTELSVLNRKCGLIWLVSAAIRASCNSLCCDSSLSSFLALFQIFNGSVVVKTVVAKIAMIVSGCESVDRYAENRYLGSHTRSADH